MGCEGATTDAVMTLMEGLWQVTIDDIELEVGSWEYIVSTLSTLGIEVTRGFEPDVTTFINGSGSLYRLRFVPVDAAAAIAADTNNNPTVVIGDGNIVTFCLAASA